LRYAFNADKLVLILILIKPPLCRYRRSAVKVKLLSEIFYFLGVFTIYSIIRK
jgi:hypothetical protein